MKEDNEILTRQETEQLCRAYLEGGLTVMEETELRYLLDTQPYKSPVIDEARESMLAEMLLMREIVSKKKLKSKPRFKWLRRTMGIAATLTVILALSAIFSKSGNNRDMMIADSHYSMSAVDEAEVTVIAYEGGKRLSHDASVAAVNESMRKAESLMAMAEAREMEENMKQEYIMQLMSE